MKTVTTRPGFTLFFIFHFAFFVFHFSYSYAQVPTVQDCLGAIPICQEIYVELDFYSGNGNYDNEIYEHLPCDNACPGSCLAGEVNSVWYVFTVQAAGKLRLTIDPVTSTDDYDWAVYDLTELDCSDIYSNYGLMQRSCNAYGSGNNGNTGISTSSGGTTHCNNCGATNIWNADLPVNEGSTYVLVVENWSGSTNGFTLDFSASTASIFDESPPKLDTVFTAGIECGATEITVGFSEKVICESVDPSDFQLTGPGGPIIIFEVQGEACMVGGEMEKQYVLFLNRPISSNGVYFLQLLPGNDVYDACDNIAVEDTIAFYLDLGAPVVNDSGIIITAANYELPNGSITGIEVNGTGPLSYHWFDDYNDTVGTGLDLYNVYSGSYHLRVTDTSTCETQAGPYFVDLVEGITEAGNDPTGIISVFPNPNPGIFTIQVSKDVANISLINMMGNVIHSYGQAKILNGTIQADLQQNGRGIYLIRATSGKGKSFSRIVQVF